MNKLFPFQLCGNFAFEDAEHLKKPFKFSSNIVFGNHDSTSKNCPVDKSKFEVVVTVSSPENALEKYKNLSVEDSETCTKEIVKFTSVSLSDTCKQSHFNEILAVTDFNVSMIFERVCREFKNFERLIIFTVSDAF